MSPPATPTTPIHCALPASRRRANASAQWLSDRRRWTRRRCGAGTACFLLLARATGADAIPAAAVDIGSGGMRLGLREAVPLREVAEVQFPCATGPALRLQVRAAFSGRTTAGVFILGVTFTAPLSYEELRRLL